MSVRHPVSTNFHGDHAELPPAKRRKPSGIEKSVKGTAGEISPQKAVSRVGRREIPDSDADSDDDDLDDSPPLTNHRQTELESALPPVKTDKEAIEEYEATRAADDDAALGLEDRLGQRQWVRGKNSIYVDAFNLALDTVLSEEQHLFDEVELAVFEHWRQLEYQAQYLYVRLFLRKTAAWHRISRLGYYSDIGDPVVAAAALRRRRDVPPPLAQIVATPGELAPPPGSSLGTSFTWADASETAISSLDEASSLLTLDELKALAKEAKVQGKNKAELLAALRRSSKSQGGLPWAGLRRAESEAAAVTTQLDPAAFTDDSGAGLNAKQDGLGESRDAHFVRKILASTGSCIRLSPAPLRLFERVHLVFYRSTEWTEKSLTTIILAQIARRNFPNYIVSRSCNIFPSRVLLLEFEASIRTQFRIDNILEFNGTPTQEGYRVVMRIFDEVYPRWRILLEQEQRKEDRVYESGEGAYLRRFSPAWVYSRIVHKGAYVLGRVREHQREHEILVELLAQRLFHSARRGVWYQRKALLEEHYMAALTLADGQDLELQKKVWRQRARQTCEEGLQDRNCHHIYHYDLQKRICKLEKKLKVVKREQHEFGHVMLVKPLERWVEGVRIERVPTPSGRRGPDAGPNRGTKTIWRDGGDEGSECSVEEMCLSWYRSQGWKGYHSEGGIVRTLFAYLFFDILFLYIPNVFQTPYQTCPLDLHTDAFFASRASEINHRLVEITNGAAGRLIREVDAQERERKTCAIGLDWSFELDDLLEIAACFDHEALATICKVMAQEYQQRGGGMPDLFLWHPGRKTVCFSEVKSENDRLSDTQRLWIHVLTAAGVTVELCNAVAREVQVER
ncbi:MAG: hypothetical protein M1838_003894 [Thelocarpon superellum]|nr:MAG: hypothetical protein M1838_003894 [Thelocarpon superellum]